MTPPRDAAPRDAAPRDAGPSDAGFAGRYAFDFQDADLPELVRAISAITGKRFLLTGQIPHIKATVRSPDPVTADEAYRAFLTILHDNALTIVKQGAVLNIVTESSLLGH